MGLLERLVKKESHEKEEGLTEILDEMLNIHNRLEQLDNQFVQLKKVDQQLEEANSMKHSALMVANKLEEIYRDVQLISQAIRNDDNELRSYIQQQVNKIEFIEKNSLDEIKKYGEQIRAEISMDHQNKMTDLKESYDQQQLTLQQLENQLQTWNENLQKEQKKQKAFQESIDERQLALQQLENQIHTHNEKVQAEQKKKEEELAELRNTLSQKEKIWQSQMKRRDVIFASAFLLLTSISLWALWN
ncbi:coiled-coil domain-containing protein [Risungbinella massiliensis]|uniref:hypothetical protein n=1 Tax=Risungbinella massiliensis TaxID=1329796 RepID=UPI0005CBDA0C|nr:hypothetical protein [Risungbinella massiliensis]